MLDNLTFLEKSDSIATMAEKDPSYFRIDPDVSLELSRKFERDFTQWEDWQISLVCMRHGIPLNLVPNAWHNISKWTFAFASSTVLGIILTSSVENPGYLKYITSTTAIGGTGVTGYIAGKRREKLDEEINTTIDSFNIPKVTRNDN
jgi:hypothetical protein